MAQTRFTCTLTTADEPACQSYARVTIVDSEGAAARGCPRHAVAAEACPDRTRAIPCKVRAVTRACS